MFVPLHYFRSILLTKTTALQNEVALSYHRVRGLYFLAVVFAANVVHLVLRYRYHFLNSIVRIKYRLAHDKN